MAALFVVCSSACGEDALATELGKGHSGPEVRALQRALNFYGSRLEVAGVFEDGTERAVRRFQRLHDLEASGVADAATLERLMQPLKLGDSGSEVRRLQRLLEAPATGVFRSSTLDAVKTFQRKNDLEVTGEFSPRLLGLFDDDPEAVFPDEDEETDEQKQEQDGTRTGTAAGTPGSTTGAEPPGFDELGQPSDSGSKGSSGGKAGDTLKDLFSGLAKSSKSGGGGQFAPGQGQDPTKASTGSSTGGGSSSGKPLGGGVNQREDPLAHVNQRGQTRTGQQGGSQSGQQGGSQSGQQGGQQSGQQGGSQSGQQGGSQSGQQGGSQSGQQGGQQSGQQGDDVFTSKQLPFKDFKSLTELASALEVLKTIEQIEEALGQGTIEEPLVQAMRAMQGKLKGQEAKALIDLAIKVYEIPGPDGKNIYIQPALTAVLKAKAIEIGAVPTGPGANATAKQAAAHDAQVAARFPSLK